MERRADLIGATREQFDSVFDVGGTARVGELFHGDGSPGIDASLVDPCLKSVEVDMDKILGKPGSVESGGNGIESRGGGNRAFKSRQ